MARGKSAGHSSRRQSSSSTKRAKPRPPGHLHVASHRLALWVHVCSGLLDLGPGMGPGKRHTQVQYPPPRIPPNSNSPGSPLRGSLGLGFRTS